MFFYISYITLFSYLELKSKSLFCPIALKFNTLLITNLLIVFIFISFSYINISFFDAKKCLEIIVNNLLQSKEAKAGVTN